MVSSKLACRAFSASNLHDALGRDGAFQEDSVPMKEEERHIHAAVIRDFAYRRVQLQVHEFRHIQECDQCSHTWWTLKQEAKREKDVAAKEGSA